jgi:hypothetical protein
MRTITVLWLFVLLSLGAVAPASAGGGEHAGGIVYGKDHAFNVQAPQGWVLDNQSGVAQGLHAVFYPKGSSWEGSPVIMYAQVVGKRDAGSDTLEKVIRNDISYFRERSKNLNVTDAGQLPTAEDGKTAAVRYFTGDAYNNHEAIAYNDGTTVVVLLILSSKTQKGFEESLPAFRELVKSYRFITDKVDIEK